MDPSSTQTPVAAGVRLRWSELPGSVRQAVVEIVGGGPVVAAESQTGGFSPGTADRLVTADGRRAFVKAVSPAQNPGTPDLHRREARVVASLPGGPTTPTLLGLHDDGEWVAAVYADIDGANPAVPWGSAGIGAAVAALSDVAERCTPSPVDFLQPLPDATAGLFGGWRRLRDDPLSTLDPWARDHLDELAGRAERGRLALGGDTLVHLDIRADNLLVRPDGTIAVVDWPWASVGAAWFDRFCLLVNVDLYGGHDVEAWAANVLRDVDPATVTDVLTGICGFFTDAARQPPLPGLPTVRAFQAAQARTTLAWLRRRLDR